MWEDIIFEIKSIDPFMYIIAGYMFIGLLILIITFYVGAMYGQARMKEFPMLLSEILETQKTNKDWYERARTLLIDYVGYTFH